MKFKKKPLVLDAVEWLGDEAAVLLELGQDQRPKIRKDGDRLVISTLEGDMSANLGDMIIKGVAGEIYPCRADIFRVTFDPIGQS